MSEHDRGAALDALLAAAFKALQDRPVPEHVRYVIDALDREATPQDRAA